MSTAADDLTMPDSVIALLADQIAQKLTVSPIKETLTFGALYQEYFEKHVKVKLKNSDNAKYFYSAHGPRWRDIQVHQITRKDLQAWVDELGKASPSAATRALNMMSAIINWGIRRDLIPAMTNPCKGVEKFRIESRETFLAPRELVLFNAALAQEAPIWRDFFHLCLFTGARRGNVLAMQWSEIDFDLASWTIPGSKFKNGSSHTIPLTDDALTILRRRSTSANNLPWVFPSPRNLGHLEEPKRAFKRVLARAGLTGLRIHDLRRTLASYLAIKGTSPYVIARMLGHKDMRSTSVYARLDISAVREAAESVNEKWQVLLSLQAELPTPPVELTGRPASANQVCAIPLTVSSVNQVLIEAKILGCIKSGGSTKSDFYTKLGTQFPIRKADMSRILAEMEARQLVRKIQTDAGYFKYFLNDEATK